MAIPKGQINASNELLNNFDKAVQVYKKCLQQRKQDDLQTTPRNVSQVDSKNVEVRWYTREEFRKLSPKQKAELKKRRHKGGFNGGSNPKKAKTNGGGGNGALAKAHQELAVAQRVVAALEQANAPAGSTEGNGDADAKSVHFDDTSNRTHAALQKGNKKK